MSTSSPVKRVVITGIGMVTPAGGTLESYWDTMMSGQSVLRPVSVFDASAFPPSLVGEVDESILDESEKPQPFQELDRGLMLCSAATGRALKDSGLMSAAAEPLNIGICLGTGAGPTLATEEAYMAFAAQGAKGLRPKTITRTMFNSISSHVAIQYKLKGSQFSVAAACASANMAMSRAVDMIRLGKVDRILTGGVEMPICKTIMGTWVAMRILSRSQDPQASCLPFDKRRTGLALAEGSAMFMFEELSSALNRGAKIYAEVLGYGESCDATHITAPDAPSQASALTAALQDAGISIDQVDYINAHGTSTGLNDLCETEAIKIAFGARAKQIPISSTKSFIGHGLGASGALELPAILGAFKHQVLPPTANLREFDPQCDLDYVPCTPREACVNVALSNSFAFGGANCVLALKRWSQ